MSQLQVKVLEDYILVGSLYSGHDLVQNMYGMYLRYTESTNSVMSNMNISLHADDFGWNRLRGTQLGYAPIEDAIGLWSLQLAQEEGTHTAKNRIRITRDYKDVLVHAWREHSPEMSFTDFCQSDLGFSLVEQFEQASSSMDYAFTISYEKLVEQPAVEMAKVIYHLMPKWDGVAEKLLDVPALDTVIQDSGIRELRKGPQGPYLEKVEVYAEHITPEEAAAVDAFVASL